MLPPVNANDFQALWDDVGADALGAIERVGRSGWYILSSEVQAFEADLCAAHGVSHAIGCASGLDAIEIGVRAAGVGAGDEVLTTPLTAFATTLAILRAGANVTFADVDENGLLDLEATEAQLKSSRRIRAIVPVHLYGQVVDIERLKQIADAHGCLVIEDAAQAICAKQGDRPVGSTTVAAATSFYPTKNLGALGDGGALLTNRDDVAMAARELRDYGQRAKYEHVRLGLNSRLDELHAAVLRSALLPRLPGALARRSEIAVRYRQEIHNEHLSMLSSRSSSTWHIFPVFVAESEQRDSLREHLKSFGVQSAIHYPILASAQEALNRPQNPEVFPVAHRLAQTEVSLPLHPYLTDDAVTRVISATNQWRISQ